VVHEKDLGITWHRALDRESGEILLRGIFENFGVTQDFRVWGHDREEMLKLLTEAGFAGIDVSPSLSFSMSATVAADTACLRYRARVRGGE